MRTGFEVFLTFSCLFVSICASGATQDDSWQNLRHVTRERFYTVLDRQSNCVTGHITAANDHLIKLKLTDGTSATFDRANVLRISVSQAAPSLPSRVQADIGRVTDIVYNGTSSWRDLKGIAALEEFHLAGQPVRIVKSDGKQYEGLLSEISDTELQVEQSSGKLVVVKSDVAQAYYLRFKPLTDSEKYSAQEDFWIDPRLWPYYLHVVPKMRVGLYDSSLPEDNTPVRCPEDPAEKARPDFCFSGYVQSIDPSKVTLQRPGREAETVQLSKNTSVRVLSRQISTDQIKVGDGIIACGSIENDEHVAQRITVQK